MAEGGLLGNIRNAPQPPAPVLGCSKVFACILPIAQIAIGAKFLDECPQGHYIPIYLIVCGVFSLALALLSCLPCVRPTEGGAPTPLTRLCETWTSLTSCFLLCWFIAGNVWIYSIYEPNYNKNATSTEPYCDKTLYLFAFWITTLVYILLGLALVGGCCTLVCLFVCGRADPDDNV